MFVENVQSCLALSVCFHCCCCRIARLMEMEMEMEKGGMGGAVSERGRGSEVT